MKKFLCLFGVVAFVLTSCSSEDNIDSGNEENLLLPKTEKYTYGSHPEDNSTVTYSYDGNKITSLTYDKGAGQILFTYTGDLITKTVYTENYESKIRSTTVTFIYENNKLKSLFKEKDYSNLDEKWVYTYNSDGTITCTVTDVDLVAQTEKENWSTTFTLDASGNIVKEVYRGGATYNYTWDKKNSPFKNILGYKSLLNADVFDQDINSIHNIVSTNSTYSDSSSEVTTFENTYNESDFLIKRVNDDEIYEYTY